jgi:CelD/BcsL family acetyltransferase involved in cellulose biosynthesis
MGGRRDSGDLTEPTAPDGVVAAGPADAVAPFGQPIPALPGAPVVSLALAPPVPCAALPRPPSRRPRTELRVEVVTDLDELAGLAEPWRRLVRATPTATPFASPAFVLTWFRHLERPRGAYVVTVWRGDTLVGLAPFARTRLGGEHTGFQMLVSAGTEHGDHGEPLLGPQPEPVAGAVAGHLARLVRSRLAAVNARRLFDDGPMLAALRARDDLARVPMGHVAHAAVVRFDQLDDPHDHLERLARRHDIPRRMRRLAEAHGPVDYVPDDPRRDAALDTMAAMLQHRWGTEAGPRLFATPGRAAFTRAVTHALAADGMGRLSTLSAGGRLAAVSTVLQVGDRLVSDNAAFDVDLCRFGVGQAEIYRLLRHALEAGVVEVDMRAGDFPYKRKWTNAERRTRSVVLVAPGRRGELSLAARRAALRLRTRRIRRGERHPKR